jgi:hypothetical protein
LVFHFFDALSSKAPETLALVGNPLLVCQGS